MGCRAGFAVHLYEAENKDLHFSAQMNNKALSMNWIHGYFAMQNRPSLKAIQAFEAASRLGSFALAAEELSVTPSAVSHQIKLLEEQVGIRLFHRIHRS